MKDDSAPACRIGVIRGEEDEWLVGRVVVKTHPVGHTIAGRRKGIYVLHGAAMARDFQLAIVSETIWRREISTVQSG